jgi:acetyltransferase-like isoleucine patch superfamily enzyme
MVNKCGDNVRIGCNVQILGWDKLKIGSNVSIHDLSYIDASGGVEIGDNVSIAHNCSIISSNHQWTDLNKPIKYNSLIYQKVLIEQDVWLGCGCRVLSGVCIKSRSIIAAGSIVNKNNECNTIYGGVPAKLIKRI